jgi:predicted nuclease with TOPRIM domain
MPTKQEEMSKLEKDANELVNNIKSLDVAVRSYKTAKESLEDIKSKLENFIDSTNELSHKSHQVINKLIDIGSAELENQLNSILKQIQDDSAKINKRLDYSEKLEKKKTKMVFVFLISGFSIISILQVLVLVLK